MKREAQVAGGDRVDTSEFDLLHQLASRPGIVYSRAALLQNVWSDDSFVTERTVDTVISRLLRKVERAPRSGTHTYGVGRRLQICRRRLIAFLQEKIEGMRR